MLNLLSILNKNYHVSEFSAVYYLSLIKYRINNTKPLRRGAQSNGGLIIVRKKGDRFIEENQINLNK